MLVNDISVGSFYIICSQMLEHFLWSFALQYTFLNSHSCAKSPVNTC